MTRNYQQNRIIVLGGSANCSKCQKITTLAAFAQIEKGRESKAMGI